MLLWVRNARILERTCSSRQPIHLPKDILWNFESYASTCCEDPAHVGWNRTVRNTITYNTTLHAALLTDKHKCCPLVGIRRCCLGGTLHISQAPSHVATIKGASKIYLFRTRLDRIASPSSQHQPKAWQPSPINERIPSIVTPPAWLHIPIAVLHEEIPHPTFRLAERIRLCCQEYLNFLQRALCGLN